MSKVDEAFQESVASLQAWLQFLERKLGEYQNQLNRVRRSGQPAPQPVAAELPSEPAPPASEDPWL